MKINFKEVELFDIEGNVSKADVSQAIGNYIHQNTADIGTMELAKRIYMDGEVELSKEQAAEILSMFVAAQGVRAVVKVALQKLLTWQD